MRNSQRTYINLNRCDCIFNELEALIHIFEGVKVGTVYAWLEASFSKLMTLDLLSQLGLDLEIDFHRFDLIIWGDIYDKVEPAKLNFRGESLSSIQDVENHFGDNTI